MVGQAERSFHSVVHRVQVTPGLVVIFYYYVQPEVLNALGKQFISPIVDFFVNQATHPQTGIGLGPAA